MSYFQEMNKKSVNRSERVHERCCVVLRYEYFRKGEVVFFANEKPDKFFIIFSGAVNILIPKTESNLKKDIKESQIPLKKPNLSQKTPRFSLSTNAPLLPPRISRNLLEKYFSLLSSSEPSVLPSSSSSPYPDLDPVLLEPGLTFSRFRSDINKYTELLGGLPLEYVDIKKIDGLFEQGVKEISYFPLPLVLPPSNPPFPPPPPNPLPPPPPSPPNP